MSSSEEDGLPVWVQLNPLLLEVVSSVDLEHPHVSVLEGLADAFLLDDVTKVLHHLVHEGKDFIEEQVMQIRPWRDKELIEKSVIDVQWLWIGSQGLVEAHLPWLLHIGVQIEVECSEQVGQTDLLTVD